MDNWVSFFRRYLYTPLLYAGVPFILIRLYWKGRRQPAYRQRISERFSMGLSRASTSVDVWVHAVSLGEVVAATPMIEQLLAQSKRVLVTTMTPTGSEQVVRRFGERVQHQYVPYDLPRCLRRFFASIQAKTGIIMETELWPNLIVEAKRAGLALFLANARISPRAFTQYHRLRWLFKPIVNNFDCVMAQSPQDQKRFYALGARNVQLMGNMKFDQSLTVPLLAVANELKQQWQHQRVMVMAASTHEGEEAALLSVFRAWQEAIPNILLLIAPRHADRFEAVYQLIQQANLKAARRSDPSTWSSTTDVMLVDSLGELSSFYAISDYAFVGGSLVNIGGHNVLEPIALGVPVLCGPYMQNSQSIVDDLLHASALIQVSDASELIQAIVKMHNNVEFKTQQVESATLILKQNQGAVARHLAVIS